MSSSRRRPMTLAPATSACTSPTALSGVRLFPAMMRKTSSAASPARYKCTGGRSRPSAKVSVASAASPPAETPPTSATWISVPPKKRTRPSANTGRKTQTSFAWMPPRYGSFIAYTSPVCIVASGMSSSSDGSEHRKLAACMRLVAVDNATSCACSSRTAAHASAPSWMNVLCAACTTITLASSAATSNAPLITSVVISSSTLAATGVVTPRPSGRERRLGRRGGRGRGGRGRRALRRDDAHVEHVDRLRGRSNVVRAAEGVDLLRDAQPVGVRVPEDRILVRVRAERVELLRSVLAHDNEERGSGSAGTAVRQRHVALLECVLRRFVGQLVGESARSRRAALIDEVGDDPVEGRAVVVLVLREVQEAVHGLRCLLGIECDLDVAATRVQHRRVFGVHVDRERRGLGERLLLGRVGRLPVDALHRRRARRRVVALRDLDHREDHGHDDERDREVASGPQSLATTLSVEHRLTTDLAVLALAFPLGGLGHGGEVY